MSLCVLNNRAREGIEAPAVTAEVHLAGGLPALDPRDWRQRPFRVPHHTASSVALIDGGSNPRPGEISLAHQGILFLDELPEFERRVLETLREPLESGHIHISRPATRPSSPPAFNSWRHEPLSRRLSG